MSFVNVNMWRQVIDDLNKKNNKEVKEPKVEEVKEDLRDFEDLMAYNAMMSEPTETPEAVCPVQAEEPVVASEVPTENLGEVVAEETPVVVEEHETPKKKAGRKPKKSE